MATANLALRFLVELFAIVALAHAGWRSSDDTLLRTLAAIGAPAVLIAIWAGLVAPNADSGLSQPQKDLVGTVLLLGSAGVLGLVGQQRIAAVYGSVVLVNALLLFVLGHDARQGFS